MSAATAAAEWEPSGPCHVDEWGNLAKPCHDAVLDSWVRGYVEGHAAGYAAIVADIDRAAAQVVNNVISDRSRRWQVTS